MYIIYVCFYLLCGGAPAVNSNSIHINQLDFGRAAHDCTDEALHWRRGDVRNQK